MRYGNMDPARPFQTLPLVGILPPAIEDRFADFPENNQLLYNGISTFYVDDGGIVRISRAISTYRKSANGADDPSYLDLNTGLTLSFLRNDLRVYFRRKYPRHKLGDDSVNYGNGQAIMTPLLAKAECIARFAEWEKLGLVENAEQFSKELIVERDEGDRNRLNFRLPPDLMNQFRVGAAQIQFLL
jgi:phage tail sheath gpL-like